MTLVLILINTSVIPRITLFIHLIARSDYSIEPYGLVRRFFIRLSIWDR